MELAQSNTKSTLMLNKSFAESEHLNPLMTSVY